MTPALLSRAPVVPTVAPVAPLRTSASVRLLGLRRSATCAPRRPCRVTTTSQARRRPYSSASSGPVPRRQPLREAEKARKSKEPFDAELTVLFGLPTLILLVPWAVQEPQILALFAPLLLLVPGPRDIAAHMAENFVTGTRRAKRFMSRPERPAEASAAAAPPPPPSPERPGGPYGGASWEGAWQQPEPPAREQSRSSGQQPYQPPAGPAGEPGPSYAEEGGPYSVNHAAPAARSAGQPGGAGAGGAWGAGPPPRSVVAAAGGGSSGRLVRGATRGRVGIDVDTRSTAPVWLRAVFVVLPWLRSWGGFM